MARMSFADLRAYMNGKPWANFVCTEVHVSRDDLGMSTMVVFATMLGDAPIVPFNSVVYLRSPSMMNGVCLCGYVQEIKTLPPMGDIEQWEVTISVAPRVVRGRPADVLAKNLGRFLPENAWRYKKVKCCGEDDGEDDGRYDE